MSTPALQAIAPTERDVRAELADLQAREALTQAAIAKEAGLSSSAVNRWIKGVYSGDNAAVEAAIARWIDAHRARELDTQRLPEEPTWYETPTGARVLAGLSYAQMAGDVAVIYGAAGTGKTRAVRRHQATNPSVWHATMTPATATVVPALEEIADAVGLREASGGAARLQRAISRKILDTRGLLVVDEAQHLSITALDEVRALHDATGVGIALVGNESVYARLTGGNRAAYLDRLYSRVGARVRIQRSSAEDVTALAGAWKVTDAGVKKLLAEIAATPGGLRGATKILRLALLYAAGAGRSSAAVEDVRVARQQLGGAT